MAPNINTSTHTSVAISPLQMLRQIYPGFSLLLTKGFLSQIKTWFILNESLPLFIYTGLKAGFCLRFFLPAVFYVSERRRQASLSKAVPVIFLHWAYHYSNDKVRLCTLALSPGSVCLQLFFFFFTVGWEQFFKKKKKKEEHSETTHMHKLTYTHVCIEDRRRQRHHLDRNMWDYTVGHLTTVWRMEHICLCTDRLGQRRRADLLCIIAHFGGGTIYVHSSVIFSASS